MTSVLVVHSSPHGSTAGIAERIAGDLRALGLDAQARPVDSVEELTGWDALIIGSALHGRAWTPQARQFVAEHVEELRTRAVWLYSVGMPDALARPLRARAMVEGPRAVADLDEAISSRGSRLFSGVVTKQQFPLRSRILLRMMGGRYGDFRNWSDIDAWAHDVGTTLLAELSRS